MARRTAWNIEKERRGPSTLVDPNRVTDVHPTEAVSQSYPSEPIGRPTQGVDRLTDGRATMRIVSAPGPPPSRRRRAVPAVLCGTLIGFATVAFAACGGGEGPSAERFCGEIAANKDAITNPTLVDADDIEPFLEMYREIATLAPLAVEDDWNQLLSAYETASTVVPGDEASEQEALAAIYSSEKSAAAIERWLRENCAVDIGPVFTIVPHPG